MGQVLSLFQLNQARFQNLSDQFPKEVVSRLRHKHNLVMNLFSFPNIGQILELPVCTCRKGQAGPDRENLKVNLKKKKKLHNPLSLSKAVQSEDNFRTEQ